ncbi:MAG: NAD(P)H-dependent oxidoreductase [Bacteroidota bacterium]
MKKIIAFGASNSKKSINQQFAQFAVAQLRNVDPIVLDLNNFELPLYSVDLEIESGIPANAIRFSDFVKSSVGIIISLAEYNGLHTSAFKNLWDWLSRMPLETPMNIWMNKPMFLLGTSPSRRESSNVMRVSLELFPHFGAQIISNFHLPSFNHYFKEQQIIEEKQRDLFATELQKFQAHINEINT